MNEELKEYTCNIVLDFGRSYMAKSKEEFVDMVLSDFYEEHGYKLDESELKNITEVKWGEPMNTDKVEVNKTYSARVEVIMYYQVKTNDISTIETTLEEKVKDDLARSSMSGLQEVIEVTAYDIQPWGCNEESQ